MLKAQHTQQGRGGATVQVELRDVQSGLKSTEKLRTSEAIDCKELDSGLASALACIVPTDLWVQLVTLPRATSKQDRQ